MNSSTTIPASFHLQRNSLLALVGAAAAVAAVITGALFQFTVDTGAEKAQQSALTSLGPAAQPYVEKIAAMSPAELQATFGTADPDAIDALGLSAKQEQYVRAITSLAPAALAAGAAGFGTGNVDGIDELGFTPKAEAWVRSVTSLTPEALAAGAAGFGTGNVDGIDALGLTPKAEAWVRSVTSLTPEQLAAGAAGFGTGK
jgi:hypothetical protein